LCVSYWYVPLTSKHVVLKSLELFALQGLCKKISGHVVGPAVLQCSICTFPFST
jgi:hypothetical protein